MSFKFSGLCWNFNGTLKFRKAKIELKISNKYNFLYILLMPNLRRVYFN